MVSSSTLIIQGIREECHWIKTLEKNSEQVLIPITFTKQTGIAPSQSTNSATTNIMYSVWGYQPIEGYEVDILNELFDEDVPGANDYRVNQF